MDNGFMYEEGAHICKDEEWPYLAKVPKPQKCAQHTCSAIPSGGIKGFMDITPNSEQDLMTALTLGPVAVAIQADQFAFQSYTGGIFTNEECLKKEDDGKLQEPELDHGVVLTGYGTDKETGKDYWVIKNSWGAWGANPKGKGGEDVDAAEKGYILFERGANTAVNGVQVGTCGIQMSASYPCVKGGSQDGCTPGNPDDDDDDEVPTGPGPYEKPPCQDDEFAAQIKGLDGSVCAPKCDSSGQCRAAPKGSSATPTCALEDPAKNKYCVLVCASDGDCPTNDGGANCQSIQGTGICMYKDGQNTNAVSVNFVRDVVNAKKPVDTNDEAFETETIYQ